MEAKKKYFLDGSVEDYEDAMRRLFKLAPDQAIEDIELEDII